MGVPDHVERAWNLMDVAGDPHAVDDALVLEQDVGVVVGAIHVGHDRELDGARALAHHAANRVLLTEFPLPVLARREQPPRRLVAQLAIVHPSGDAGVIDSLDEGLVELVIVDQATVANGAIENLDVRAVADPVAFGVHVFSVQHRFPLSFCPGLPRTGRLS